MQARVIALSESQIYLEIENQIRFRGAYVTGSSVQTIREQDHIDFRIERFNDRPTVIINSVLSRPGMNPGLPGIN